VANKPDPSAPYPGFEQGPIRPPSEARSLLLRITRNCPWNRCAFCPVYKGERFSLRPVAHVKKDIDLIHKSVTILEEAMAEAGRLTSDVIRRASGRVKSDEAESFYAAAGWLAYGGQRSVFLQDADSLIIKAPDLIEILQHLRTRFPEIQRVTSYARSRTIAKKKAADLKAMREAGLNRLHVGLETGSDEVLAVMDKGTTKAMQITAGQMVKAAGIELSEYVMPGLGGRELSRVHAVETADALNQIDPDFIRLRTLAIPSHAPLMDMFKTGKFKKCTDLMVTQELHLFISRLDGIHSALKSDHVLNLFMDLQGRLPQDKQQMLSLLQTFLDMSPEDQRLYQVGRRLGMFIRLADLGQESKRAEAEKACRTLGVTADNVDDITDSIMTRFI